MHSHDDALIAALAEGSLDPSQASAAEAAIAPCARCNAELQAQRAALTALASAPPAALRDDERRALRSSVAASLGLETTPATEPVRRRPIPWGAVTIAAAALVAIVAVVPLAGLLNTAADTDDAATALAVSTTDDTSTGASEVPSQAAELDERAGDLGEESDGAGGEPQIDSAPSTTYAATSTVPGAGQAATLTVEELAAALAGDRLQQPVPPREGQACASEAEEALGPGASALSELVLVDGETGIAYLSSDASAAVVFHPDGCRKLAALP
jgi:hypothetical protein